MNFRISLPVQLLAVIASVLLFGNFFSAQGVAACYTFSVIFKELLSFILPSIVFSFVLTGILSFKKSAPLVLGIMLAMIFCSNGLVALASYAVMNILFPVISCRLQTDILLSEAVIEPLYTISLPQPIRSEHALLAAIALGLLFSFVRWPPFERAIFQLKNWIEVLLNAVFIPLLPLYVLGFLLKIRYEGLFVRLMQHYGRAVILIIAVQVADLIGMYILVSGFSFKRALRAINTALPSYLTAFSTMSSTATIPVSIDAAEKNMGNRALASMAMPIMANVHLLGDSISTPILAMMTMLLFKGCLPALGTYLVFVFYFCTTMFAVSGIPGGGILVMIPILKSQLGFTPEMVSIIIALYLLLDSFGTAANVMGDGALVMMVHRVLKRLRIVE